MVNKTSALPNLCNDEFANLITDGQEAPAEFSCESFKQASLAKKRFFKAVHAALLPFIHIHGIGKILPSKDGAPSPKPLITKAHWRDYQDGLLPYKRIAVHKFSQKHIQANNDRVKHYYTSNWEQALIMLDIDAPNHSGTPTAADLLDADQTALWLLGYVSKYVYADDSSARGRHLYLKLKVREVERARKLFSQLASALNAACPYVSKIEVKGTVKDRDNCGLLARLPIIRTEAELQAFIDVPTVNLDWLAGLVETLNEKALPQAVLAAKPRQAGSCLMIAELDADADRYYNNVFPKRVNDCLITKNDNRVWFTIQAYCTAHPNEDGTNPVKRHKALWDSLYEQGLAEHKWHHSRYAAIRDHYSAIGLIVWLDHRHYVGKNYDGVACKWYLDTQQSDKTEKDRILVAGAFLRPLLVSEYSYWYEGEDARMEEIIYGNAVWQASG